MGTSSEYVAEAERLLGDAATAFADSEPARLRYAVMGLANAVLALSADFADWGPPLTAGAVTVAPRPKSRPVTTLRPVDDVKGEPS